VDLSNVKPDEAWRLVPECWGALFKAFRAVRGIATGQLSVRAESMEKDRAERKSPFHLYNGQQGHSHSKRICCCELQKYPAIATVINYPLFGNRVPQSIYDVHTTEIATHIASYDVWRGQGVRELATLTEKK